MKALHSLFVPVICCIVIACSSLQKSDPEKEARDYLLAFQNDLSLPADSVLKHFKSSQSKEVLLALIEVLQNKDPFVKCTAPFSQATISVENGNTIVYISATFRLEGLKDEDNEESQLVFWLSKVQDKLYITHLEGEAFYQAFTSIKNRNEWEAERLLAMQKRLPIYEAARALEPQYDSVVWFSEYENEIYFYVVQGTWDNYFLKSKEEQVKSTNAKMGLINKEGKLILPMEFDLIGAIGFIYNDLVEVKKDNKIGYADIKNRKIILEPQYEFIIPYDDTEIWALASLNDSIGWINQKFEFKYGYPSEEAKQWHKDLKFLQKSVRLKSDEQAFCEIPNENNAGNGIIVPPHYLYQYGIFEEVESHITTTPVPMNAWTDYKETDGTFTESVSNTLRAVVTTIRERYLEGREEFYTHSNLLFVNHAMDTVGTSVISGDEITMHAIDSTLLELRTPEDWWFAENEASEEYDLIAYTYFAISNGTVEKLSSRRLYPQTEFVKLDSSYLTGNFSVYDQGTSSTIQTNFLSYKTISFMRDEILATYGYTLPDEENRAHFMRLHEWYTPKQSNIEEIYPLMNEIDLHNVRFLDRVLSLLAPSA